MNEYDKTEDMPTLTINLVRGDRELFGSFPIDVGAYDIMDTIVGLLIALGYDQSHIEHWIADKYGATREYR